RVQSQSPSCEAAALCMLVPGLARLFPYRRVAHTGPRDHRLSCRPPEDYLVGGKVRATPPSSRVGHELRRPCATSPPALRRCARLRRREFSSWSPPRSPSRTLRGTRTSAPGVGNRSQSSGTFVLSSATATERHRSDGPRYRCD